MRASLLALVLMLGCGDGGEPDPLSEDTVVPLSWDAGERVAMVTVHRLTRDPLLGDPVCAVGVQLGEASAAGQLASSTVDGACFVDGAAPDLSGGFTPLDGGTLDLRVGGTVDRITVDGSAFAEPLPYECSRLEAERTVGVVSVAGESATDALGAFDAEIGLQAAPTFTAPTELRAGIANWPAGDLRVAWNGGLGDSVEVVLSARDGGPALRCYSDDDGELTIPARLADRYRGGPATLEVGRVGLTVVDVDGVAVHLASRSATQLWLEVPE